MAVTQGSIGDLQRRIGAWSKETFPQSPSPHGTLRHLRKEVSELHESIMDANPEEVVAHEAADVFILLVQFCTIVGIDLERAVEEKHAINQRRTWLPPNAEGVVYHDPTEERNNG